jgi:hypothetical protein
MQQNINFWVTSEFQLKHHVLKHSLIQQDGTRSKDITRLEFETPQHDKVTSSYSARRRAKKLTIPNISKITP